MMSWSATDLACMKRAIELAKRGEGFVAPNPMVGCIICAPDGRIIGAGWHEKYGEAHAEVNAHRSVAEADRQLLPLSTWYVTLEPCNHVGKTPACASLIESVHPARVVVSALDSNPTVQGGGINRLRQAGIQVHTGCLETETRWQNRRFFCNTDLQRTYVILKWAQSRDGFMDPRVRQERKAGSGGRPITSPSATPLTHRWRAQEMGIAVGVETAIVDEPTLNVRHGAGKSPQVIVIDPNNRLPHTHPMLERQGEKAIIHIIGEHESSFAERTCHWNPKDGLKVLLEKLWEEHRISSVLVEGGARTLTHFISEDSWDEMKVWTSNHDLNTGLEAPKWPAHANIVEEGYTAENTESDHWTWGIRS